MTRLRHGLVRALRAGAVILLALSASAAPASATSAAPATTGSGPTVTKSIHNDTSTALRDMIPAPRSSGHRVTHPHGVGSRAPRNGTRTATPSSLSGTLAPSTTLNFDGVGQGFSGPSGTFTVNAAPPDTDGSVGPNHYFQIVNTDFAIFNKAGTAVLGPVPNNTLWSGFGGLCQQDNDGDATVRYDRIADRWVVQQLAITGADGSTTPFLICVAVSTSGDPTGSFNRYSFAYADFPDYPKLSVWPDAYYLTVNRFNASGTQFLGPDVAALDRTNMLNGNPATKISFQPSSSFSSLLPSDLDSKTLPPSGEPNFMIGLGSSANSLAVFNFHTDFGTPSNSSLTGPTTLATNAFSQACGGGTCIPQAGTSQQLDSLGDRLMFRLAYRNFGDHESLVAAHSVTAGSSTGVRWYELRVSSGTPAIFQQGTYAPDSAFRWMPSIAMDSAGDIAVGFSISSSSTHPGVHYAARLPGDPAGTMGQGEAVVIDGNGSQSGNNLSRWGDYSGMTNDPSDDCTFFYTNQYEATTGSFNWHTRVGSFRFSSCGTAPTNDFSVSVSPSSQTVTAGSSTSYTVSTAVTSGSAVSINLSASGLPSGATASFSSNPVTAGNSSTMTVSTSSSTPAGTSTITVTGTSGSTSHSATTSLTVNSAGGGNVVVNGGFETGDFTGWARSGNTLPAIVTSPVHTGNFAARIGSTSPDGNSILRQTIKVPSGHPTLTFWYNPTCTDTIQFDQQTVQIRSTSGSVLATVLNVCNNSQTWTQVSFDMSQFAGQTVVLYFRDHDDGFNNPPDPTFFYLDDVSVQ